MENKGESLFLVSSALTTKHGVYHRSTRIRQTNNTIDSIKRFCPAADFVIIDGGQRDLEDYEKKILFKDALEFKSFANDPTVKSIQSVPSHDIVKNMIEIYMFSKYFEYMLDNNWHKKYKRFFKLSGRYELNENFDYQKHLSCTNGIVISNIRESQFSPELTGNAVHQYMSRLWSFDSCLLPYISDTYNTMLSDMKTRVESNGYIDIEHLLYKHLDQKMITNFNVLGVKGNIAPNGVEVSE